MNTMMMVAISGLVLTADAGAKDDAGAVGSNVTLAGPLLTLRSEGRELLGYQAKPIEKPLGTGKLGPEKFRASHFIHPLRTPSGFVLTEVQPADHRHHLGLWWPWKYLTVNGRKINCWELQEGEGIVQARKVVEMRNTEGAQGFTALAEYVDRTARGGAKTVLNERLEANIGPLVSEPAHGYFLDLKIAQEVAVDTPVTVLNYRYSGFSMRGTAAWNIRNSTFLTSEAKGRDNSNGTRARWVQAQGAAGEGKNAGVVIMTHPGNRNYPEPLRTWDSKTQDGAIFVNFNPVQDESWVLEPGKTYVRKYRLFVYDGEVTAEQADALWRDYSAQ